jgi:hypothetical protein
VLKTSISPTALIDAVKASNLCEVKKLFHSIKFNEKDDCGRTALHYAVLNETEGMIP